MERNKRLFVLKNIRKVQKHPNKIEALNDVINILEQQDWIPIKIRALTDEEKKEYGTECEYMLDCPLPEDGEEILISIDEYVQKDTCCMDDSFYLYSGYDWTEVDAWMPLPKGYKKETVDET